MTPLEPKARVHDGCQLMENGTPGSEPFAWYCRRRARNLARRLRRRLGRRYLVGGRPADASSKSNPSLALTSGCTETSVGDRVRVRPLEDILRTLDENGACCRCAFLAPMARFCGQEFRVVSCVNRFFDERQWRMLKCKGIVLLDGVHCDGSGHPDTRGCDRMCFLFWRIEWLERIG